MLFMGNQCFRIEMRQDITKPKVEQIPNYCIPGKSLVKNTNNEYFTNQLKYKIPK